MWKSATTRELSGSTVTSHGPSVGERGEGDTNAEKPVEQVAERQPPGGRIGAGRPFQHRIDRGAEIGAEHQGEGGLRWHGSLGRERHDQQHNGHARMRRPGQPGRKDDIQHGLRGHRAEEHPQARHVLVWREQIDELVQGHQHQAKPDQHATEVTRAGRGAAEHQQADQDQRRGNLGDVERQHLHDQRGADIGAEHDGKRGHQIDETAGREAGNHKAGRRAALQDGGDTDPGQKRFEAVAERAAQEAPELCPEGPLHARLDHVDAPEEKRHRAGKVHQGDGKLHRPSSFQIRN